MKETSCFVNIQGNRASDLRARGSEAEEIRPAESGASIKSKLETYLHHIADPGFT